MATINWIGTNGDWSEAFNWSTGTVPGAMDDAVLPMNHAHHLTISTAVTVHSILVENRNLEVLVQVPGAVVSVADTLTNDGTLHIESANAAAATTLLAASLVDNGKIQIDVKPGDGGSLMQVGTLTGSGGRILVGSSNLRAPTTLEIGELASGFDIEVTGSQTVQATVKVTSGAAPDVLATGSTLEVGFDALLEYASGKIRTIDKGAYLLLGGSAARIADASDTGRNSVLDHLSLNMGQIYLTGDALLTTHTDFDNRESVSLFGSASGKPMLQIAGSASNSGKIDLDAFCRLAVGHDFSNNGSFLINRGQSPGGSIVTIKGALTNNGNLEQGPVHAVSSASSVTADQLINNAAIAVRGGSEHIPVTFRVVGSTANSGNIDISGFGTFLNGGDLTSSAVLNIDTTGNTGGSILSVKGTLTNGGTLTLGSHLLDASDLAVATTLNNSGILDVVGQSASDTATFKVTGAATNSGTVDIEAFASLIKAHSYMQTAGETIVNGAISLPDTFVQGGLIDGTGKITSSVVVTGGAIAGGDFAGGMPGTLAIHGKLVDSSVVDATLVAAGSGTASDIDVSGTKVSLRGGTLDVHITDPANLQAGETFTILTFTPGILTFGFSAMTDGTHTGDGNSLDLGNGFTLDASYDNTAGKIELTVVATPAHAAETLTMVDASGNVVHHDADGHLHGGSTHWVETGDFG